MGVASQLSAASTEYVHVRVVSRANQRVISIAAPPQLAFLTDTRSPEPEEWLTGEWADRNARILLGPNGGAITLEPGTYHVWLSWTAGVETPVYRCRTTLTIY